MWESDGRRSQPIDPRRSGEQTDVVANLLKHGWTIAPSLMLMRRTALEAASRALPGVWAADVILGLGAVALTFRLIRR